MNRGSIVKNSILPRFAKGELIDEALYHYWFLSRNGY